MQIVRFKTEANTSYGVLEGGVVVEYSGTPWSPFRRGRRRLPLKHAVLLAPTLPSKIIAVELNYRDRAAEMERRAPDEPRFSPSCGFHTELLFDSRRQRRRHEFQQRTTQLGPVAARRDAA